MRFLNGLSAFTIVDSVPFMGAVKRRRLIKREALWKTNRTPIGGPIDQLLIDNIAAYSQIVCEQAGKLRQYPLAFVDDGFPNAPESTGGKRPTSPEWMPPPEQLGLFGQGVAGEAAQNTSPAFV